jgi:cyclomaltodextrinase / maltogenic alpha-amylase / neopullulanase
VCQLHQELISLRRRHAWLQGAGTKVLTLSNERLVYKAHGDGGALTVALNLTGAPVDLPAPAGYGRAVLGCG